MGIRFFSNREKYLDQGHIWLVDMTGAEERYQALDIIPANTSLGNNVYGSLFVSLDNKTLLANYYEGLIHWNLDGSMVSLTRFESPIFHDHQVRMVGLLNDEIAVIVAEGDPGQGVHLMELGSGEILSSVLLDTDTDQKPSWTQYEFAQLADGGKYLCMKVSPLSGSIRETRAICFRFEDNKIQGPWFITDPATGDHLKQVRRVFGSRQGTTMVIETEGTRQTDQPDHICKSRILVVDLEALTSSPTE